MSNSRKIKSIFLCTVIALLLSSCGGAPGGGGANGSSSGNSASGGIQMGSGLGDDFMLGVIGSSKTALAAGETITLNVNIVDLNGQPYVDASVSIRFSSTCAAQGISDFSDSVIVTTSGFASTQYSANGCTGEDIITARADDAGFFERNEDGVLTLIGQFVLTSNVTLEIEEDTVVGIEFIRQDLSTSTQSEFLTNLSLPGGNGERTSEATFRVIGAQGAPVIGEQISFDVTNTVGGTRIVEGRETATSDNDGLVRTVAQGGTVSTTFAVEATHETTGSSTLSDSIIVSSGVAVDSKFSLSQSLYVSADAWDNDGVEITFSIIASDSFGNNVPDGTQVFFASPESGNIGSSCLISSGECEVLWQSAGSRPLDRRLSIIAYTDGAEDYLDTNGNNVYDAEDTFNSQELFDNGTLEGLDLDEPYIDENENENYDIGEYFVDTNENRARDLGNNLWDGPCLSEVNSSALCDGATSVAIFETRTIAMPDRDSASIASTSVSLDGGESWSFFDPETSTIDASTGDPLIMVTYNDGNAFTSLNPPAPGTLITATLDADEAIGGISGSLSYSVPEDQRATPVVRVYSLNDANRDVVEAQTNTILINVTSADGNRLTSERISVQF